MTSFIVHFLTCNLLITLFIAILFCVKHLLRNRMPSRMHYRLWLLLLIILAVPLLPALPMEVHPFGISTTSFSPGTESDTSQKEQAQPQNTSGWLNDFAISVTRDTPSAAGYLLFGIWAAGGLCILFFVAKSNIRFYRLCKSAMPLQNPEVYALYQSCLAESGISRKIPIYSTAFLKSPVYTGLFRPRIYLPIRLISDLQKTDLRYMLLHELQHYKHRDMIPHFLMNLALMFYWFNPMVWLSFLEMHCDRETACDSSVLEMLAETDYADYGRTLLRFAHNISDTPFPFAASFHNGMKQMKRRILQIASYQKPSFEKRAQGLAVFLLISALMLCFAPVLLPFAADDGSVQWNADSHKVSYPDFSSYFKEFDGSLVLYDSNTAIWYIYNPRQALTRISPDSTYKIYDALFGLDAGMITPQDSLQAWNGHPYPIDVWNQDQTLATALSNSVNWYFQSMDQKLGRAQVSRYLSKIRYGNETVGTDLSSYWMESDLKISPLEQVILLTSLYEGKLPFASEHAAAVLEGISIPDYEPGSLYGKTGTGRVNGKDVNGWFIGYIEGYGQEKHTVFFAANIQGEDHANGSAAAAIVTAIFRAGDTGLVPR